VLRLFLAWRLLRVLFVLLLFGFAALALAAAFGGDPRTFGRGHSSLADAGRAVERAVMPFLLDARTALIQALTGPGR
jgi:hypothetical protein